MSKGSAFMVEYEEWIEMTQLKKLETMMDEGIDMKCKYIVMRIDMVGFPSPEIIINPIDNFKDKIEYIKKTYNDDLTHKFSSGISISDFDLSCDKNDLDDVVEGLLAQ